MSELRTTENRFEELYTANREDIFRYARRRTATDSDALDAVSDTFSAVWSRIHDAPSDPESRLWIFGIARNVLRNQSRSAARRHNLLAKVARTLGPTWESARDVSAECDPNITRALSSLNSMQREIIQLSVWEDLSSSEIARVLDLRDSTVRSHLARGLKKLEEQFSNSLLAPTQGVADAN